MWFGSTKDNSFIKRLSSSTVAGNKQNSPRMSDRDSAAEEVRAVATKITNLEQTIDTQQTANHSERERLRSEIERKLEKVRRSIEEKKQENSIEEILSSVNMLSTRVQELEFQQIDQTTGKEHQQTSLPKFVWRTSEDMQSPTQLDDPFANHFLGYSTDSTTIDNQTPELTSSTIYPHYTIPPTTTLLNATALTALVGRIPVKGRLQDPWRFKIIIGSENLAANGHRIPQLAGMLWAGTARGDFSLSCVSGNVDTATFIYLDGTIQTSRAEVNPEISTSGLGWISDEFGNPCISGELKSNALNYLTQSTLVNTAQATADALSNAQTESRFDAKTGESTTSVVGDIEKFIAGYATRESLTEVSQWLNDRQLNSFDAIYIPAGQHVAIHIEEPISIDYDPSGRKTRQFGKNVSTTSVRQGWID